MDKLNFKSKLILYVTLINFFTLIISYGIFINTKLTTNKKNINNNLVEMSKLISTDDTVLEAVTTGIINPKIDKEMDKYISIFKDIDIIVIADITGKKYSHLDKSQIGQNFVNPVKWDKLLQNEGYFSTMLGSMGVTTRWFEPILSKDKNKVLGFVMVGKYDYIIKTSNSSTIMIFTLLFLLALTLAFILSVLFAGGVKKSLFGLEPEDITQLHIKEQLIINNLESGLIALDDKNNIVGVNEVFTKKFPYLTPEKVLNHTLHLLGGNSITRTEITIDNNIFYIKILPICQDERYFGNILLLKTRDDVDSYAREITGIDQLVEGMRANIHEFKNRLHVILGLININKLDLAKKYILEAQELNEYDFKKYNQIKNPFLKAILLGKEAICKERKIEFIFDPESKFDLQTKNFFIQDLSTIIGNLIENSIESFIDYNIENKFIQVQIFQNKNSFSIAITDNGKPISDDILSKIFDYGFSTKGQNRGVGLYLVQEKLKLYKGNIRIEREKSKKTFIVEVKNEECINC